MKKLFFIFLLSALYLASEAQFSDAQLWTGPMIKYKIGKKVRLDFEQQFRFNQNISKYDFTFSEFALKYSVFKYLDLKAVYRHSFIPSGQTGTTIAEYDKSRFAFDLSTGTKIFQTGLKAGYRFRYQNSWENKTLVSSNYLRNRFDLSYNLSKLVDPYISWDSYYRLDKKNEFRQNRYTLGFEWKITKKLDIDSYFHFQKEKNVKNPETDYIIGLAFVYSIN